jgi:HPt (histidine-containing phosphotransfer) domain-containing protein
MVDWERIADLRRDFGHEGFGEIVALFLEEADAVADQLRAGLPGREVEARLHFLKGAALNLGLTELAALCQDGERRAARGLAQEVDLALVAQCYAASRALLVEGLAGDAAA